MRRHIGILATALSLVAAAALTVPSQPAHAQQVGGFNFSQPNVVASGLAIPWGMAFLPGGDALVVERASARLLRLRPGTQPQVLGTIPNVDPDGEGGLLGLAVSPNFSQDGWVYAYHTSPSDNRIVRFQLGSPQSPQPVLTGIPRGTQIHNGGRIAFGPDGMLYAATGDAGQTANSQNQQSLAGKILRMTPTGGVPAGNPFNSLVYSLGHRNVQGLAWDSQGRLFASEFGAISQDEVNLIVAGGNYGWPTCEGPCNNPNFRNPLVTWSTAQASPSGAAIGNNTLFVAALRGQRLWTMPITGSGVGTPSPVLQGQYGRIRTVEVGPDGWLWITTSNRDGRGQPAAADDRVVRFPPTTQTSPSPSPSVSPSPPVSPSPSMSPSGPPQPGGCTATYRVANQWSGGFQGEVTVTNSGTQPTAGWTVTWTFPSGQTITQLWNGSHTQTGANVTVRNVSWNGTIPVGGATSFGFLASWNASNGVPADVACTRT